MSQVIPSEKDKQCGACGENYSPKNGHSCRPASPINVPDAPSSELLGVLKDIARSLDKAIAMEVRRREAERQLDMFK